MRNSISHLLQRLHLEPGFADKLCGDPEYRTAHQWAQNYHPDTRKAYKPVSDYASWRYSSLSDCWEWLDKKADDVTRYATVLVSALGAIGGLIGSQVLGEQPRQAVWLTAPLLLAVVAFVLALKARPPSGFSVGGDIDRLLDLADTQDEADESQVQGAIAASLHVATTGLRLAVAKKAGEVTWAIGALFASVTIFSLLLCFVVR